MSHVCMFNFVQLCIKFLYNQSVCEMIILIAVNLSTDTVNKLRIYQENFEQVYISSAVDFYTAQASAYLNENGIQNYMKYVRNTCM